ncbi:hypothetical protein [Hansschlegelia sp.]|uniref:hypothetical protein n=1 Tax=Hansschlegelia sp. TaxID=2041892 RepID=UPI002C031297|nr:hypothetical protein [Hansschlegelia sp.]HVI28099.1 hypothetical protein [Hansschlegelia sp.]
MPDLFIDDVAFDRLVEALSRPSWQGAARALSAAGVEPRAELITAVVAAGLEPCIVTGGVDRNAIMRALGDVGGVWPESILPDVTRATIEHMRRQDAAMAAA